MIVLVFFIFFKDPKKGEFSALIRDGEFKLLGLSNYIFREFIRLSFLEIPY